MRKEHMDVSALHVRISPKKGPLDGKAAYCEAEIDGMSMKLPTVNNPSPMKVVSNENESIDISKASKIFVEEGEVALSSTADFNSSLRPRVYKNMHADEEEISEEIKERFQKREMRHKSLKASDVNIFTNDDGRTYAQVVPAYGNIRKMSTKDAYDEIKGMDEQSEEMEPQPFDLGSSEAESDALDSYMQKTVQHAATHPNILNCRNPIDNTKDTEMCNFLDSTEDRVRMREVQDECDALFNMALGHSASIAEELRLSQKEFEERLSGMPKSVCKSLFDFYTKLAGNEKFPALLSKMDSQSFAHEFRHTFPETNPSNVYHIFSNFIQQITGMPNSAREKLISIRPMAKVQTPTPKQVIKEVPVAKPVTKKVVPVIPVAVVRPAAVVREMEVVRTIKEVVPVISTTQVIQTGYLPLSSSNIQANPAVTTTGQRLIHGVNSDPSNNHQSNTGPSNNHQSNTGPSGPANNHQSDTGPSNNHPSNNHQSDTGPSHPSNNHQSNTGPSNNHQSDTGPSNNHPSNNHQSDTGPSHPSNPAQKAGGGSNPKGPLLSAD